MQRFYGGDPMRWLEMPREVVRAYAENLPNVQSAELLTEIGVTRIAHAGRMKLSAARRHQRRLERETEPAERRPADLSKLRAAGINVIRR